MAQQFYLEHDVKVNGKRIKILGIMHSTDPLTEVTDKKLRKVILQRARRRPNVRIYSEWPVNLFVPRELYKRTEALETWNENKESRRKAKWFNEQRHYLIPPSLESVQNKRLHPDFKKPTFIGRQLHAVRAILRLNPHLGNEAERYREVARIITKRSLTMAQRILDKPEAEMIVVVGASHAEQIKKFLENPKLRERYRKLWEK